MVKGYKTINIKEELIQKIRNLDENKKEVEEGRFNLAGYFVNAVLEHMSNKETARSKDPIKEEGLTTEQVKNVVKVALNEMNKANSFPGTSNEDISMYHGLTKEELAAIKGVVGEAIAEAMH